MGADKIPQKTPTAQAHIENEPVHKSLLNQKGSFLLILGVIVILVVLGAGGYFLTMNKNQDSNQYISQPIPTSTQPTSSNETANWKTYTNTKYSYSLQLPQDWKVSNYEGNAESNLNLDTTHEIKLSSSIQADNKVPQVSISVALGSETITEDYLQNLDKLKKASSPREVNYTLGGVSSYRTIENNATLGKITTVLVAKNRLRYQISSVSPNTTSQDEIILNQILSTFKFTR